MKYTYSEIAKMIDHSLLHPTMTDQELDEGCALAAKYQVASVCIKPYAVKRAAEILEDSGVLVGAVIGFPHGNSATDSKRYETELACRDGADEIDMVINIGKALSGDWEYVERDIKAVCDEGHRHGAKVKVIFENDHLADGGAGLSSDELKRRLCQIAERAGADWVKTSTGYGFVKQPDGGYGYKGATEHDLALMRASCSPRVQIKAAGGVRDLDGLIKVRDLGASRCGATATAAMLEEFRRREAAERNAEMVTAGRQLAPRLDGVSPHLLDADERGAPRLDGVSPHLLDADERGVPRLDGVSPHLLDADERGAPRLDGVSPHLLDAAKRGAPRLDGVSPHLLDADERGASADSLSLGTGGY